MELDVLVWEIISRLPLKEAVRCKVLNKDIKARISDPQFFQTWFQRQEHPSTELIYTVNAVRRTLHKITLHNPLPIAQIETPFSFDIEILASCNGLILFDFEQVTKYCVFNPVTGEHQLIPYPLPTTDKFHSMGFAVDYPNSDQYKLVTISELVENSNLFYNFHLVSSERPGLWREIQLRTDSFISFSGNPPVYLCGSLYWLRCDGSVVAFDTRREEAILINRPAFIDQYDLSYGNISTGQNIWLGRAQGVLTLVCIFRRFIVLATYDNARSSWTVTHTLDNFISHPDGFVTGFPVWIDSNQVSFLKDRPLTRYHDLYEYDTEINDYRQGAAWDTVDKPMYCFHPTLASVHQTPFDNVETDDLLYIAAKLNEIRGFIIEGIIIQEGSSSGEVSSSEEE